MVIKVPSTFVADATMFGSWTTCLNVAQVTPRVLNHMSMLVPVEFGDYAIPLVLFPQLIIGRIDKYRGDMREHVDRE